MIGAPPAKVRLIEHYIYRIRVEPRLECTTTKSLHRVRIVSGSCLGSVPSSQVST